MHRNLPEAPRPVWQLLPREATFSDMRGERRPNCRRLLAMLALGLLAVATGCHAIDFYTPSLQSPLPGELEPPCELSMVSLPAYRLEPPDALHIDVVRAVPRPPYQIGPQDTLLIRVAGTLIRRPIDGNFLVDSDGVVTLGAPYASVRVLGMTTVQAAEEIRQTLLLILQNPDVTVQVLYSEGAHQLSGNYPVEPDGVVRLGIYGEVFVAGMTVAEASHAVQQQLCRWFDSPEVGIEVTHYNSKSYYVIMPRVESAESVQRYPITGNETVLDAVGRIQQFSNLAATTMWVARAEPGDSRAEQILPVDWEAIARGGETKTNYQLMPGDRLYIVADSVMGMNTFVNNVMSPFERLFSITSLGLNATKAAQTLGRDYNSTRSN